MYAQPWSRRHLLTGVLVALAVCCALVARAAPATLRASYGLTPPSSLDPQRTALVLVDFQREFFHGGRLELPLSERARVQAVRLLGHARRTGLPVVHVRNVATRAEAPLFAPGSLGVEYAPELAPVGDEHVVTKALAGAFSRTELASWLAARGVQRLIIGGLMTHLAVDTTARDATVLGLDVIVAADATAARGLPDPSTGSLIPHERVQSSALAILGDRFASIMTTAQIVALPVRSP